MQGPEITINIKKSYIYVFVAILGLVSSIIISNAIDSKLPWHSISQIKNNNNAAITDESGNFINTAVQIENAIKTDTATNILTPYAGVVIDGKGIAATKPDSTLEIHRMFWEGTYNSVQPWNMNSNIRLCYYQYNPSAACSSVTKNCAKSTKLVRYKSTSQTCNNNICDKICKGTEACNGIMNPESSCSTQNAKVNYIDGGSCNAPGCSWNSGVYLCGCNCNLNNDVQYNVIHQGNDKKCLVFYTNG